MDDAMRRFDKRARKMQSRHRKLARGYKTKLGKNGVIQHYPIRHMPFAPGRTFVMLALCFIAFKVFLLTQLGADAYTARLASLKDGTVIERLGGMLMQVDPATAWVAGTLVPMIT